MLVMCQPQVHQEVTGWQREKDEEKKLKVLANCVVVGKLQYNTCVSFFLSFLSVLYKKNKKKKKEKENLSVIETCSIYIDFLVPPFTAGQKGVNATK